MANQENIIKLIKSFSGQSNLIAVPRLYIAMLDGDINTAILLSQIVYWSDKSKRKDGWFYKTYSEWYEEIGLSQYKIKRGVEALEKLKILETDVKRANGTPTVHYKINMTELENAIIKFLDNRETSQSENEVSQQSENEETSQSLTDTTQESTQKTIYNTTAEQPQQTFYTGTTKERICELFNFKNDTPFETMLTTTQKTQIAELLERDGEKCFAIAKYYCNEGMNFQKAIGRVINNFGSWKTQTAKIALSN